MGLGVFDLRGRQRAKDPHAVDVKNTTHDWRSFLPHEAAAAGAKKKLVRSRESKMM